jgi:hypothetical protein
VLFSTLSFFWLVCQAPHLLCLFCSARLGVTLTFFSLFGILSISSCELLLSVPIVYHEVDSALSFQTIFFSRFSALVVERSVVNRFPSAALLMYQLGLGLSSVFAENFKYFLQPYTARLFTVE